MKRAWDQDVPEHGHHSEENPHNYHGNLYQLMAKLDSGSLPYSTPLPKVPSQRHWSSNLPTETDVSSAFPETDQEAAVDAINRPSNQWPPYDVQNVGHLSATSTIWENYPIWHLGPDMSFQGPPGYSETELIVGAMDVTSSDGFWRELLGLLASSEDGVGGRGPTMP
ncbi:hypothetical protein FRB93_009236 [Tulasnella sp. JGI-2019a]|nr:hypothetical protein FRB93_009236 [Tulasnella sp. JGI-2019a]